MHTELRNHVYNLLSNGDYAKAIAQSDAAGLLQMLHTVKQCAELLPYADDFLRGLLVLRARKVAVTAKEKQWVVARFDGSAIRALDATLLRPRGGPGPEHPWLYDGEHDLLALAAECAGAEPTRERVRHLHMAWLKAHFANRGTRRAEALHDFAQRIAPPFGNPPAFAKIAYAVKAVFGK